MRASVQKMSKMHFSVLQKRNELVKEKGENIQLCSLENAIDSREKLKVDEQGGSEVDTFNSKFSSYSEELLPFNKRKSQYYIIQEDAIQALSTNQDNSGNESEEEEENVKIMSLKNIYKRARQVTIDVEELF